MNERARILLLAFILLVMMQLTCGINTDGCETFRKRVFAAKVEAPEHGTSTVVKGFPQSATCSTEGEMPIIQEWINSLDVKIHSVDIEAPRRQQNCWVVSLVISANE